MSAPVTTEVDGADAAAAERARLGVLAASMPIVMLAAPTVLPFENGQSLFELARREAGAIAFLVAFFVWPVFVGALGFARALQGRPPGKAAFGVPAALVTIAALLGLAAITMAVLGKGRMRDGEAQFILAAGIAWAGVLLMIVRGIRRASWERWVALVAAFWLFYAGGLLLFSTGRSSVLAAPSGALWAMLFGLSAAALPLAWAMRRKRG